jgi:hypothetical protein
MTPRDLSILRIMDEQREMWGRIDLDDIHKFEMKDIDTFYVKRAGETFMGISLEWRELPGFDSDRTLRVLRLDKPSPEIVLLPLKSVASIDGAAYEPVKTEWTVTGSRGDNYNVKNLGEGKWSCTCAQYKYRRKECKHIKGIRDA